MHLSFSQNDKKFSRKENRAAHIRNIPRQQIKFLIEFLKKDCWFYFKENNFSKLAFYLYSLQTSTEPIKFGPGDYRCPYCHKKSEKKQHMQYHIRVHTGEQPFKCPYCPKKFTHKHNRSQHIRNIHTHDPYQIQN